MVPHMLGLELSALQGWSNRGRRVQHARQQWLGEGVLDLDMIGKKAGARDFSPRPHPVRSKDVPRGTPGGGGRAPRSRPSLRLHHRLKQGRQCVTTAGWQ